MWDLDTIIRINQKAAEQARKGLPERDALFLATGVKDPSNPGLVVTVPKQEQTEADAA